MSFFHVFIRRKMHLIYISISMLTPSNHQHQEHRHSRGGPRSIPPHVATLATSTGETTPKPLNMQLSASLFQLAPRERPVAPAGRVTIRRDGFRLPLRALHREEHTKGTPYSLPCILHCHHCILHAHYVLHAQHPVYSV